MLAKPECKVCITFSWWFVLLGKMVRKGFISNLNLLFVNQDRARK